MISTWRLRFTGSYHLKSIVLLVFFTLTARYAHAQCTNATLAAYSTSPLQLNTYAALQSGGTAINYIFTQFGNIGTVNCPRWSLTVKASQNFTCGSAQVDVSHTSVRFNSMNGGPPPSNIGISGSAFPLSRNEVTLINRSNAPLNSQTYPYFEIRYDFIVAGGNHLMTGVNGDYTTNLTFTLRDQYGNSFASATITAAFQIYYDLNNNSIVKLQNGANNVSLVFNTPNDYANGVSSTFNNGLSVTCYTPHQVMVKAATASLVAPGIPTTIPISIINLTLSVSPSQSGVTCHSVQLSAANQVVADNPRSYESNYQIVLYTLKFTIAGNSFSSGTSPPQPGTYNNSIVFILVPK